MVYERNADELTQRDGIAAPFYEDLEWLTQGIVRQKMS